MKKTTLLVAVLMVVLHLATVNSACAQFSIGVKVAANTMNYKQTTSNKLGADAGVFLRFGKSFYFQPEVNYSFKSSTFSDMVQEFSTNSQLKQHFISVPALLGYHFINNDNFKFHLTLGPRFDFKIADNIEGSNWQTNNLQWGGQFGIGFDFWRFTLDLSYCIALDNFHNTTTNSQQTKPVNIFTTSLGFKFIK